jgi:hypothetical protein
MFIGKTTVPIVFAILLFILGLYHLVKEHTKVSILLMLPIFSMLVVSVFGFYSIITRMVVFLIPNFLIVIGFGIQYVFKLLNGNKVPTYLFFTLIGVVLLNFLFNESSIKTVYKPYVTEEGKEAIEYVSEYNHPLYLSHSALPFYMFYTKLIDDPIVMNQKYFEGTYEDDIELLQSWILEHNIDTITLLDIHTFGDEKSNLSIRLKQIGEVAIIKEFKAAEVSSITLMDLN